MKRIITVFLTVIILSLSVVCASAVTIDLSDMGKTIVTDGDWALNAIDGGKYFEIDEYRGTDTDLVLPRIYNDKMITKIRNYCFVGNTTIKSVETSSPLWTVGEYAFLNCSSIERFECNFALKEIEVGAFSGCTSLKSIDLENSAVSVIRPHAFMSSGIETVRLPDTCTEIMHDAFSQCPHLRKIVIPRSVTTIDNAAFNRSDSLVIYCYTDSYAHEYAQAKGIPFVLIDQPQEVTFLLGDSDGDGKITILDATKIQRVLAELVADADGMIALRGNTSSDTLDIMDATRIQRFLASMTVSEPIGTVVTRSVILPV